MKIAFNPSMVAALTTPPNNKDITFDLRGHSIFARGVEFKGTDTNTWRDIKINNVSIGSHTLDLRNGSNTTLTNTNGVVTINSTWRPVVDNLTSDSTTSSLSAKQGKVLKALIDGKSDSDHNHDGRYLKLTGGTMASNALITFADSGSWDTHNKPQGARGGLYWTGQSDYAKLYAEETAGDNLDLVIQFGDDNSNGLSIRNKANTQTSYISAGGVITTGTFKGNLDWSYITNKPASYTPSAHTHAWNSLTHSSTTENQAILTNGKANGWKLYTLNISRWDNAANNAHSHANKSVLDGITSALVNSWNTAYNFVSNITGTDTDKVINKWEEIVNFLAGITEDNKLNTLLNSKLSVYELADKTNVGTIKNNGIYYSTTDASSRTLINSPFNTGFAFINMTSYDGGDDLRRSRLAFNAFGEIKVSDDRDQANTAETWYNVLTSKNSGINGSTIKLNGTSITVYSSGTADGRYVKKSGDTMQGVLTIDTTNFGALTIKRNDDANGASIQFRGKSSVYGYIGLNNSTKDKQFLRWSSDISRVYTILDTSSTYISNGKGVINGTTITQVDNATNSTNSTNARKLVNWYSARPTSLNAQFGDGSLRIFYATSSTTEGKPAEDSHILHLAWDNTGGYDAQLAVHARSGKVSTRAQNGGTWQPWKTLAFTTDIPSSLKNPYSFNVFGVVYDGSAAKTVTTSNFISQVTEGMSTITDGTMLITSYATNSGFADTNAVNVPYKRKAIHLWEYIKTKTDSLYATKGHNHDGRYLRLSGQDTMQGNLYLHSHGTSYIGKGLGDKSGADFTEANIVIRSWWGISFKSYDDIVRTYIDTRTGNIGTKGVLKAVGAVIQGRVYNDGDDAGIIINPAPNGYAGLILGTHNGERSVFYLKKGNPFWRYNNGSTNLDIYHPKKSGTIALTSDIPNKDSWNYDDRYLKLTGGWMSGDINFGGDNKIYWGRNTDSASISFKNDGDGDANSYMSFVTSDNGNEYFRWSHSSGSTNTEWMALRSDGLRVRGTKVSLEGHTHDDRYYTKAESNAKYITDITTSVNKLTFTKNGSNIIRDITVNVVHSQGRLTNIPNKDATTKASPGLLIYDSYAQTIGTNSYSSVLSINTGGTIQIAGNWGDDQARNLYWRSQSDRNVASYPWKSWRTILDSENYSSTLDSRYYTESEVNSLLSRKLDRVNLTTGSWNPRGYHLAADYHYNGGDLSISENNGKMYISVNGCFWQNEGQYRVLDTSDIGGIQGSVTLHQYLEATNATWYPLVWGGIAHQNTSDSTGAVYKSYDKLSWQTSSQTLYATNIQTNNIKNLSIGGGIYWNPYVESATDGSDAASITLVRSGVAGGTTLVLSQMNDTNDTIQFKTNTAARLYHNNYPILTTQNTYVSNNKGYINGTEITQVNNSDTVDGWHKDEINRTLYITSGTSGLSSYWAKLWEINLNNQYNDVTITFLAAASYYPSYFSIFSVYLRQNGSDTSKNISARLVELIGNIAIGDTDLRLYVNNTTGNCQLWGNVKGQYGTMNLSVLKKAWRTATDSSNIGTFFSTSFNSVQPLPGDGWSKIGVTQQLSTGTFSPSAHTHPYLPLSGGTLTGALTIDFNHLGNGTTSSLLNVLFNGTHDYGIVAKFHSYGNDSPAIRFSHSSNKSEYNSQVNTNWSVGMRADTYNDFAITQDRGTSGWGTVRFAINNIGNVGIGINSASYKLHVVGDIYTTTGFKKNGSSDSYVLLGGGGHKAESSLRVAYASNADMVDGYHENSFLRYRGATNTDQEATLWSQIGIKQYNNALPDNLTGVYNYGSVISLPGLNSRFEIYASHESSNDNGLYYRSGWNSNKKTWLKFIDSSNIGSQTVANAYHLRINSANTWSTWYWAGQSGQPSWLWGSNDGTNMYVWNPSNFNVNTAQYLRSLGSQNCQTGRTQAYGDVYSYNTYNGNTGSPTTYSSVIGFGRGIAGTVEIAGGWCNTHLYWRSLRDCCENWFPWRTVLDSSNYTKFINNYYWANVKISASSSTTTSPTVLNLTATNSIRMGNILLENTNEINNSANGSINLNYSNSGDVSLCAGGGKVGIGTISPSQELYVWGYTHTQGFGIGIQYLSDLGLLSSISPGVGYTYSPGDGYTYRCLEIGKPTKVSCIIADKVILSEGVRGILLKFMQGFDGQIVLLKDLENYGSGNGHFWVMPSGCKIISADTSNILINQNQISNTYDDGRSRFFIYSSKYSVWIEFICSNFF